MILPLIPGGKVFEQNKHKHIYDTLGLVLISKAQGTQTVKMTWVPHIPPFQDEVSTIRLKKTQNQNII
jgi:hypothetical protein